MPAVPQNAKKHHSQQPSAEVANRTGPWHIGEILPQVMATVLSRPQPVPWGAAWEGDAQAELSAYATM